MIKYSVIHCAASVLSGLSKYHEDLTIEVVDNVLEDIRSALEVPDPRLNQRRIAQIRYLGELYNYHMINSGVIFSTLYSLISFGVPVRVAMFWAYFTKCALGKWFICSLQLQG